MEPDVVKAGTERLFDADSRSVAAGYLAFLATHVPKDLAEQLHHDALPDIDMPSEIVDPADLVAPLSSGAFPSEKLWNIAGLLAYTIACYEMEIEHNPSEHDVYKVLYATSLYLYCFISGGGVPEASGYLAALHLMARLSLNLDMESRLQVSRFLASLVLMLPSGSTDEPAALSGLLLTLSIIVGSIVVDLGEITGETMRREHIKHEWSKEQLGELSSKRIMILKQLLAEMYGIPGRVRQAADRFMSGIEHGH